MIISTFRKAATANTEIDWLVEGLISPGGWTYLVGAAGTGKSMLCIQLCDSLQEGKAFLGMKTKRMNCLYLQADAGRIEWQNQLKALAAESSAWTCYELDHGFLDDESEVDKLHSIVWGEYDESHRYYQALKKQRFTFIVFDCLTAITDLDLNTKNAMTRVLHNINRIVQRKYRDTDGIEHTEQVHFLLIHHPNTGPARGTTAGSGYKGFANLSGNMLTLANNLLVLEKSKVTSKKEILLEREEKTGRWYVEGLSQYGDFSSLLEQEI